MEEENKTLNEDKGEVGESKDTGEGGKSQTVKDTERMSSETQELEKATAEKDHAKARAKIGGVTEDGAKDIEAQEETDKVYRARINKEMAEGKTDFT